MDGEEPGIGEHVKGQIKWFDPVKGFGFLADSQGGSDVLVHANVLRNFGQSSVVEGALVEVLAIRTPRGRQASEVVAVVPAPSESIAPIADLQPLEDADLQALPLLPARVKWFDRVKGFGFANIFGRKGDVFLHVEVLRRWGFADLQSGEAVGLRVVDAPRGLMAAQILAWERATSDALEPDLSGEDEPRAESGPSAPVVSVRSGSLAARADLTSARAEPVAARTEHRTDARATAARLLQGRTLLSVSKQAL